MKRVIFLCLPILALLSGCGSWNTADNASLPDGSVVAFRRSHDINAVGQDVSSTVIAKCTPGLPCNVLDVNSGYQRGIGGAIFQGTGPAAALAVGNWAAANSLRPPQYNSSIMTSSGGASFAPGAVGGGAAYAAGLGGAGGQGGVGGQGGSMNMAPGAMVANGGRGGTGGNVRMAPGAVTANGGSNYNTNTNTANANASASAWQQQQARQSQTSTFYPGVQNGGSQTFTGGGHSWNCIQGQGCVDP